MSRIVFLLEELSMKALLDELLPRLFEGLEFLCIHHEGKQDLEKSLPRKLRAWSEPGARFVVIRDNDRGDCLSIKARIQKLCDDCGQREEVLVRIACQELEAWYLGEPDALAEAFDKESLRRISQRADFRDPDVVPQPSSRLRRLVPEFQKVSGARRMGRFLTRERNRSTSFQVLLRGIDRLSSEIAVANR